MAQVSYSPKQVYPSLLIGIYVRLDRSQRNMMNARDAYIMTYTVHSAIENAFGSQDGRHGNDETMFR